MGGTEGHLRSALRVCRQVRWGAAAFAVVQIALYRPPPGVTSPLPPGLLEVVVAVVAVAANAAAHLVERRGDEAGLRRGAAALFAFDGVALLALLWLVSFDALSASWAMLLWPLLESAAVFRLRGALISWSAIAVGYVGREVWAAAAFDRALHVSSISYRLGILLLAAVVVGLQADALAVQLHELWRARELLAYTSTHDPLTGLANRALFNEALERALAARDRTPPAVLFLDCDGLKGVNDRLGHRAGDRILAELARRVAGAVRPGDTVARLGGDEFAVLLPHLRDADEAQRIARRVAAALADDRDAPPVTASIGVAVARPGQTAEEVLHVADVAMYEAKQGRLPQRPDTP